uniref:Uncharacterized protein n=1 Tax=Rhizophora mucronata TaxID=61149 RepID=A0A2P2J2N8_RHIMU
MQLMQVLRLPFWFSTSLTFPLILLEFKMGSYMACCS